MSQLGEYLEIDEAATLMGLNRNKLALMRHRGLGPPYIKIHRRRVVYRKSAVLAWMNSREVDPQRRLA